MSSSVSPNEALAEAFQEAVRAIAPSMPLLMHGSGDVAVNGNPATQELVAALTVEYIERLVDAAVDAREMLLDTKFAEPRVPPPPLPLHATRKPSIPAPPQPPPLPPNPSADALPLATTTATRKRKSDEFWDDPLPEPKIKGKPKKDSDNDAAVVDNVDVDEWVGLAGVDLWENCRPRSVYARGIASQQFIFPICHDTYIYGRIREVQSAKLTVFAPVLQDSAVMDMVRTEGNLQHEEEQKQRRRQHHRPSSKSNKDGAEDAEEDEDEDTEAAAEEEEGGPTWPGLQDLLPAHRNI